MATFYRKTKRYTRGIRFRLSIVYSAVFGVCLILLSLFITGEYLELAREEHDQFMRSFAIDLSHFVRPHTVNDKAALDQALNDEIKHFPFLIQNTVFSVRTLNGDILYSSQPSIEVPYSAQLAMHHDYSHRHMDFLRPDGTKMRGVNIKFPMGDRSLIAQIGSTVETLEQQQDTHLLYLALIIPMSILVTAFTSTLVAGKALDPIRATIERMEEMLQSESYRPMPMPDTHDEIADLTHTYNNMLARVKRTLEAQDQFVAHASHQLNTPLAIMRGELDVLMSKARSPEEITRFHQSLGQELERLEQLVRDMLLVSRVEAGKAHFRFSPVRLDEVLTETVARLAPRAKSKSIALKLELDAALLEQEAGPEIEGERQLLGCLCENLIENAIKYSPQHSVVQTFMRLEKGQVVLEVRDQGPGVPAEVKEKLMTPQRFFRGEHTQNTSGTGLGLYLVARIAEYHGSQLEISSASTQQGALFRVVFPQKFNA